MTDPDRHPAVPGWLVEVPLAHRGLWGDGIPENTLAAFRAARAAGVGVELDVRLAADGVPVVFHDPSLDRLVGGGGPVADHTSDQLARLRLGDTDQHVPTLAASLRAVDTQPVMVEVKSGGARSDALGSAVATVLATHPGPTCVASFNPAMLRWFRRHRPTVPRVLTATPSRFGTSRRGPVVANLSPVRLVDPIAVSYDLAGLDLPAVQRLRESGLALVTWTVRTRAELALARAGADNVIFEQLPPDLVRGPVSAVSG